MVEIRRSVISAVAAVYRLEPGQVSDDMHLTTHRSGVAAEITMRTGLRIFLDYRRDLETVGQVIRELESRSLAAKQVAVASS